MSAIDAPSAPRAMARLPRWDRLRNGLFGTPFNTLVTVLTVALLVLFLPPLLRWTIIEATWTGTSADCAARDGACWAFVAAKFRFFLFAFYPPEFHWRPALVILLLLSLLGMTAMPRFWRRELLLAWPTVIVLCWLLMAGTIGGTPASRATAMP